MGYLSKVQVIERAGGSRQFYLMCPAQLAEALEMEKGEEIEWVVEDKHTLVIRRRPALAGKRGGMSAEPGVLIEGWRSGGRSRRRPSRVAPPEERKVRLKAVDRQQIAWRAIDAER